MFTKINTNVADTTNRHSFFSAFNQTPLPVTTTTTVNLYPQESTVTLSLATTSAVCVEFLLILIFYYF